MGTKTVPARPSELVILAINNLEEEGGSSSQEIIRFITQEFNMSTDDVTPRVQEALKRAINYGIITFNEGRYKIQEIPKQSTSETARDSSENSPAEKVEVKPGRPTAKSKTRASSNRSARKRKAPLNASRGTKRARGLRTRKRTVTREFDK